MREWQGGRVPELTPKQLKRFWSKVDVRGPDECWDWKACKIHGYGGVTFQQKGKTFRTRAHRVAFALHTKQDLWNVYVLHRCDRPICCNPHHLFAGTAADNAHDAIAKNRFRKVTIGEEAPYVKLTRQQAQDILGFKGIFSQSRLGVMYGVSRGAIENIHRGINWKHLH